MEEQILSEAIEKCLDEATPIDDFFDVLSLAAIVVG
jgi:hypothetical protein